MASPRSSLLPFVPAALLCVVAFVQVHLTRTDFLTPWKGGGFGMFSTTDGPFRGMWIWVWDSGRDPKLVREGGRDAAQVAAFPSERNIRKLARTVAATERNEGGMVSRVRIAVVRREYDAETLAPRLALLRDLVVEVEDSLPGR